MDRKELVDRYLESLGLSAGPPTGELLRSIVRRHVATFPFASIGPRLHDPLPLELEALFDRIVVRRRGGYCFEQNGLLFAVLEHLGYEPRLQLARVIHNTDNLPGLTHRVSFVELEGRDHLVDVGFGPSGPPVPVAMPGDPTTIDDWVFRVIEIGPGQFHLQCRKDGEPYSLYRFDTGTFSQADCELGHFYSHRHPDAVFVNHLVASRIFEHEVWSLRNLGFMVLEPDGRQLTATTLHRWEELAALLRDRFELEVTDDEARRLFDTAPRTS